MRKLSALLFFCSLLLQTACTFNLNFTGGGKPDPNIKTLSILPFANDAGLVVAYHSQLFSEQLRDKFLSQSRLSLVNANGDISMSGSITDYRIEAAAVGGVNTSSGAQQNKMIVTIKVKYDNKVYPSDSWEQTFTSFINFPQSTNLTNEERNLIRQVNEQIAQDVFNKSIGKW